MHDQLCPLIANMFQALGHPTRLAIVELLRDKGEIPVSAIRERLGLEQANVSQHLGVLRSRQIVNGRKDGNRVLYALRDRGLVRILDLMRRQVQNHLNSTIKLLEAMDMEENAPR